MQSLRHACRRALPAAASSHETSAGSVRAYSAALRKSKEERYERVMQFVDKFKASNNGQLPGISLLRKEVGGKYELLKEILQGLEKGQDELHPLAETVELIKMEEHPEDSTPAAKYQLKKSSTLASLGLKKEKKVVSENTKETTPALKAKAKKSTPSANMDLQDKKVAADVLKSPQRKRAVELPDSMLSTKDAPDSRTTTKELKQENQPMACVKDASRFVMDFLYYTDEDDDSLSDAASDYRQHTTEPQTGKINDNKSKASNVEAFDKDGGFAIKPPMRSLLHTPVVRILRLPFSMKEETIKSLCETVGSVHTVEIRRRRMADVHFNVKDSSEMNDIITRLKSPSFWPSKLSVFPAQRFFCGRKLDDRFKPQDLNELKNVRNILVHHLEQYIKGLLCGVQDYRNLLAMKVGQK